MWGWSYGGFMAALAYSAGTLNDVFSTLVSVAPVTSWEYYDTAYTERFMLRPLDNAPGYTATSVMSRIARLQDVSTDLWSHFLLVHGTADDNVGEP